MFEVDNHTVQRAATPWTRWGGLELAFMALNMVNLGVVIMLFYRGGINPIFLALNVISLLAMVLANPLGIRFLVTWQLVLLSLTYLIAFFYHFKVERISSLLYGFYFISSYGLLAGNFKRLLTKHKLGIIIRLVVYLQLGGMMLQHICYVLGLPIPNLNPGFSEDFLNALGFFRVNALSNEPSYGATIVVLLGYLYGYLFPFSWKEILRFWLPAAYLFVFFQSALATILVPLLLVIQLAGRRWWILPLLLFATYALVIRLESSNRVVVLLQELNLRNFIDIFLETDLSGAFRVVPSFYYLEQANVADLNFWLGHGIDYGHEYISRLMPGVENADIFQGGIIPFMLLDFGIVYFIAFLILLHTCVSFGNKLAFWVLAGFVMVNANFSTQLMWFFITFFTAAKVCFYADPQKDENSMDVGREASSI